MQRAFPAPTPRMTSTAAATRVAPLLPEHIIPSRWPFALCTVALVGVLAGLAASEANAPVGNLVELHVAVRGATRAAGLAEGLRAGHNPINSAFNDLVVKERNDAL